MIKAKDGWVCRSHDPRSEQWRVAIALGARPPCRVPGGVKKRMRMALDKRSKPLTLQLLAWDEDVTVRRGVARNTNIPVGLLEQLAEDENWWVRRGVAENPSTPESSLEQLAGDEDWRARQGVARNPNTPVSIIERLAEDEYWEVCHGVASNPNTPVNILKRLAKSEDVMVRGPALKRLS